MQSKIVRDKWVNAKIKVTKAGKILAKVSPGAVSGKPKKRAAAKRAAKRAVKRATPKRKNPPYPDAERDRMKRLAVAAKRRATLKAKKLQGQHPGTQKQLSNHGLNKYSVQFFDKKGRLVADYNL